MSLMRRVIRPALYVQLAITLGLAVIIFFFYAVSLAKAEPIFATRIGDLYLAFAATLWIVAARYPRDRTWLLVPILVTAAEALNALVQLGTLVLGIHVPRDPQLAQPLIVNGVFFVIYVVGYWRLPTTSHQVDSPQAMSEVSAPR